MTTQTEKRERRDWALLIFIIPIGILLILLVGQLAVQLVPFWSVNAGMNSNLEPDADGARPFALLDPILPQILTPMAWAETYLTPGADISFPPFLTFEPTTTPSPTPSPTSSTPSPTATTSTPVPTSTTGTPPPPTEETPSLCENPSAINYGGPLPCEYPPNDIPGCMNPAASNYNPLATVDDGSCILPPVSGCTDPDALNYNPAATVDDGSCTYPPVLGCTDPDASNYNPLATVDDGSCTYPPVLGCTDPDASNYNPLATVDDGSCIYPPVLGCTDNTASNFNPLATVDDGSCTYGSSNPLPPASQVTPDPDIQIGGPPDGNDANLNDGTYLVIQLNVVVGNTPDNNYDLVFYEYNNGGYVYLDWIIIGISNDSSGSSYYEVFNWGNSSPPETPDTNSNVDTNVIDPVLPDCPTDTECDNRQVDTGDLYNDTGILIDVDTASSNPPPGTYQFVVIVSPIGGSGDTAEIDAIETVEVPIPTPPP